MIDFLQESSMLFSLIFKGGFLMIPIILASFFGLAIFFERMKILNNEKKKTKDHMDKIRFLLKKNEIDDLYQFCKENDSAITRIVISALQNYNRSSYELRESIQNIGRIEAGYLEKNLVILYSLASLTPLLGFLGTVIGMVKAFKTIEALGGGVNASVLAGGIWEALITTVAGLFVSIPMLFAHNYLIGKIDRFVLSLEEISNEIIDLIFINKEKIK